MPEETIDTELLGRSAFRKLEHGFAIRDRLVDVLAEQQATERQYRRRDNSDEYTSRTAWAEWVLESDIDYTESALLLGGFIHNLRAALDPYFLGVPHRGPRVAMIVPALSEASARSPCRETWRSHALIDHARAKRDRQTEQLLCRYRSRERTQRRDRQHAAGVTLQVPWPGMIHAVSISDTMRISGKEHGHGHRHRTDHPPGTYPPRP
ncbi:hypothetical protein [Mycolicibacterium conceptionense]|uniref:hypothetical protein n=1 Tax=Mycolicibacterium conceptionense TaxID=451644 RepID=UPI003204AEAF